jgi:hypothetical protein
MLIFFVVAGEWLVQGSVWVVVMVVWWFVSSVESRGWIESFYSVAHAKNIPYSMTNHSISTHGCATILQFACHSFLLTKVASRVSSLKVNKVPFFICL